MAREGGFKPDISAWTKAYLCKMKGGKCPNLPRMSWSNLLVTAAGSMAGLGLVSFLLPSLGASAVLLYGACHVPMAQPRNVLGGHLVSAFFGVSAYQLFGDAWWVIAIGVTLAILAMAVTHTMHPPGGATAFMASTCKTILPGCRRPPAAS
ncbi:MAG: HPP family protein [Peptococcaceae bacterium]|nr:HPP family protein [Peptococcaceae bacterium]